MKQITQEQLNSLMLLLERYNIGIKDFLAVKEMFDKLPVIKEDICQDKTN